MTLNQLTRRITWIVSNFLALSVASSVFAQLQITEVMYDSVDDTNWEWFEVYNSGDVDFDLDGYYVDDTGGVAINEMSVPSIRSVTSGGMAMNTVIPAGGNAVLYDGRALSFDDSRFRAAWQLGNDVPLVGVEGFPALNNTDDRFGLWAGWPQYNLDTADSDEDGDVEVVQFLNATTFLEYSSENGFPDGQNVSIAWNGVGEYQEGTQWQLSEDGVRGAKTSVQTFLPGMEPLNDAADIGNPGALPTGVAADGLHFTEIMYNPASDDSDWEWVEILNNTGSTIDFAATPHVFDDEGGSALTEPNVTSGSIENGAVAVLFNSKLSLEDMQSAWGDATNYIPVDRWSALNNGGDLIGIWNELGPDYEDDKENDIFDAAVAMLEFSDDGEWPADDGNGSIFLSTLGLESSVGTSWQLSATDDGISKNSIQLFAAGAPEDHPGGDVASPGTLSGDVDPPTDSVDFNGDSMIGCADIDMLFSQIASGENDAAFDLNNDGVVSNDDIVSFREQAGSEMELQGPLPSGDANFDGIVDANDLNVLGLNWQRTDATSWCEGDFNNSGDITANDLNEVGQNWLIDVTGAAQAASSHAVPEPSAYAHLLVALACLSLCRMNLGRSVLA